MAGLLLMSLAGNLWFMASTGCTTALQDAVGSPKQRTAGQDSPAHEPVHDLNPHGPLTAQPPPSPWDEAPASAGLRGKQPVTAPPSVSNEPAPAVATGMEAFTLLIICYNRPEYLRRTLRGIGAAWPTTGTGPHILLSQDGNDPGVSAVAAQGAALVQEGQAAQASQAPITYQHVQHQQTRAPGDDPSGYSALARHFGWAISEAFKRPEAQYVIIVEDDLEVAVDFFGYFAAVAPVLRADPTLLAASAYNDMGQRSFVGNPARVLRSDFFPGLGWMLTRHVWAELGPKWPSGYWDDWLREPPQRQGRQVLHPEVSRTRTFGEKGVSRAQFFHKYLGNIHLNSAKVDWPSQDLRYLQKQSWDASLKQLVAAAKVESSAQALLAATCPADDLGPALQGDSPATWSGWLPPSTLRDAAALSSRVLKVEYSGFNGPRGYESLAQQIGVISDVKARVPRTAYKGVVALRHNSCIKLLVPAQWSIDFDSQ